MYYGHPCWFCSAAGFLFQFEVIRCFGGETAKAFCTQAQHRSTNLSARVMHTGHHWAMPLSTMPARVPLRQRAERDGDLGYGCLVEGGHLPIIRDERSALVPGTRRGAPLAPQGTASPAKRGSGGVIYSLSASQCCRSRGMGVTRDGDSRRPR